MSEVNNLLFIVNKYSGAGYQQQLEGKILEACTKRNIECFIEFTSGPGHATNLAKEAVSKKIDRVIAVGGDGTVNEVARSLVHTNTPMGILPKGSGNGLARHFGISMNFEQALDQILEGEIALMDTFTLNGRLSLNVSGLGFDGHVANLFSEGTRRGLWGYTKLVIREYLRFEEFEVDMQVDTNGQVQSAFMIAIANATQYGNNATVSPQSSVTDQTLQLAIMKKIPLYRGLDFGFKMFSGKLRHGSRYQTYAFQNGVLKTKQPVAFHVDGEPCGHATEFTLKLLPRSLNMIVPQGRLNSI